jgi:hypothetical protein
MAKSLLQQLRGAARQAQDDRWVSGLEAIVAVNEDPEFQNRIQVIIPALDEHEVYPKWVRSMNALVLGPGFGSFFVPPIGSEVTLFSRLGQKHNLFYAMVYNEDFIVPPDFRNTAVAGIRAPGDLKFISQGDLQLRSGGMYLETDAAVSIIAPAGLFVNGRAV